MEDASKSSSELMCCRACLATDVKLFDIYKNQLAEDFGAVTGFPVLPLDGLPQCVCGVCGRLLATSAAFRERSRRARECLLRRERHERTTDYIKTIDRLSHDLVLTLALTQTKLIHTENTPNEIKNEISIVISETIFKEENVTDSFTLEELNDSVIDNDFSGSETDEVSEIGKKIKIEKVLIPTDKVEVRKGRRMRKRSAVKSKKKQLKKRRIDGASPTEFEPNFDVAEVEKEFNVDIEILNWEQQLADWRASNQRKKTPAVVSCAECGKGFNGQETYKNHLLRHSPTVGAYPCEVCLVRFARRSERRLHRHRHALRFTCRACQFVTRDKNQAKLHFSSHAGRKFQCKHCDRSFIKRSSYLSHVRLLHAAQNVPCRDCGETFVSHFGLTQHQTKVHKAQKAASKCACASCGVVFDNADALDAHTRASAGKGCDTALRPCVACGASLPSEDALRDHTDKCHAEEFKCTECPLTFAGEASRDVHYWRTHRNVRRGRNSADDVRCLTKWRSRVCVDCGKQCRNSFILKEHMRSHSGEKPHACDDCALKFSCLANLKRHHKVVHLGQRPQVKCGECGKRLGAASLATHVKFVHRKVPQKPRVRKQNVEK